MPDDLEQLLRDAAAGPAKATGDSGSFEQHKLADLINLARFLASKTAAAAKRSGLKISKLLPPGSAE